MKVLIISPCTLPVPAVKGGAVQQLIDTIISENEKQSRMELTIAGLWDNDAEIVSKQYTKTHFVFWKEPAICQFIDNLYELIFKYVFRKPHKVLRLLARKIYVIGRIKQLLKNEDYDHVVFENMGYQLNVLADNQIADKYRGSCWYHVHNEIPSNIDVTLLKQTRLMLISAYLGNKVRILCQNQTPQISVLKNGIDVKRFQDEMSDVERRQLKCQYGIKENRKVLVFVGRMIPEKGVEEAIDAFLCIKDKIDCELLIVGSLNFGLNRNSPFEERIREKSKKAGDSIVFTGYVQQEQVQKFYQLADVAVLPSMWEEPAGLTILEAAASGTPIITTNAGGIPEYLREDLAIFVERDERIVDNLANAMMKVMNNMDEWNKIGLKAKKFVEEQFSQSVFYKNFVEIVSKS